MILCLIFFKFQAVYEGMVVWKWKEGAALWVSGFPRLPSYQGEFIPPGDIGILLTPATCCAGLNSIIHP